MSAPALLRKLVERPQNVRRAGLIWAALVVVLDLFVPRHEGHYIMDRWPLFWTVFGIVGCFLLIKVAKGVAHLFLSRDEEYYD